MSISFFIKNLNNKESITPKKVLEIGETISQYNLDESDENIEEFLNEKLEMKNRSLLRMILPNGIFNFSVSIFNWNIL